MTGIHTTIWYGLCWIAVYVVYAAIEYTNTNLTNHTNYNFTFRLRRMTGHSRSLMWFSPYTYTYTWIYTIDVLCSMMSSHCAKKLIFIIYSVDASRPKNSRLLAMWKHISRLLTTSVYANKYFIFYARICSFITHELRASTYIHRVCNIPRSA